MNKRGQSIIEYTLIAVLVILGVVFMGPYVLRSVGAHFKLWDEGVQDSFTENLNQAPVNDVPNIPLTCHCTTTPGSCGNSACSSCCANQLIMNHNCNPQLCDGAPASSCVNDPTCCTQWVNVGCGTTPIGQTPPSNNCNYGYEIQTQQCGANNTVQCVPNSNCDPQCLGTPSTGPLPCPDTTTGLTQNLGISYVNTDTQADCLSISGCTAALCSTPNSPGCTYCDPNQKCQYYNPPTCTAPTPGVPGSGSPCSTQCPNGSCPSLCQKCGGSVAGQCDAGCTGVSNTCCQHVWDGVPASMTFAYGCSDLNRDLYNCGGIGQICVCHCGCWNGKCWDVEGKECAWVNFDSPKWRCGTTPICKDFNGNIINC